MGQHSPDAADAIVQNIRQAVDRLNMFPSGGRPMPSARRNDLRELLVRNYRVVYSVTQAEVVEIRAVYHDARRRPD
jgi:plasmid stabilization system protein ParE